MGFMDMMCDARLILLGFFLILLSLVVHAGPLEVLPNSVELNLFPGQSGFVDITVRNVGNKVVTGLVPESDLPGSFSLLGFGLDPGQSRSFSFQILPPEKSLSGVVSVGDQNFFVKVNVIKDFGIGNFFSNQEYNIGGYVVPRNLFFVAIALIVIVVSGFFLLKIKGVLFAVIILAALMLVLYFA